MTTSTERNQWIAERNELDRQPRCTCGHSFADHTDARIGTSGCYDPDAPDCDCTRYTPAA